MSTHCTSTVGLRLLERGLVVLEQILPVRRVHREHRAAVAAARRERERSSANTSARVRDATHGDTARAAGVELALGGPSRFTNRRAAPGTPAGSCRKNASVV